MSDPKNDKKPFRQMVPVIPTVRWGFIESVFATDILDELATYKSSKHRYILKFISSRLQEHKLLFEKGYYHENGYKINNFTHEIDITKDLRVIRLNAQIAIDGFISLLRSSGFILNPPTPAEWKELILIFEHLLCITNFFELWMLYKSYIDEYKIGINREVEKIYDFEENYEIKDGSSNHRNNILINETNLT